MARILVVDDEPGIRELLSDILYDEGHVIELAENAAQARAARTHARPDLVLLDIWMPDTDGVSLLKEWRAGGLLDMPVVMMSGHATIDTAIDATRVGAVAFLEKPITLQKLLQTVADALAKKVAPPPVTSKPAFKSQPAKPLRPAATNVPNLLGHIRLDQPLREAREAFECAYFDYHLKREHYNMAGVAEKSGLERTHLYRKLKQLGLSGKKPASKSADKPVPDATPAAAQ